APAHDGRGGVDELRLRLDVQHGRSPARPRAPPPEAQSSALFASQQDYSASQYNTTNGKPGTAGPGSACGRQVATRADRPSPVPAGRWEGGGGITSPSPSSSRAAKRPANSQ